MITAIPIEHILNNPLGTDIPNDYEFLGVITNLRQRLDAIKVDPAQNWLWKMQMAMLYISRFSDAKTNEAARRLTCQIDEEDFNALCRTPCFTAMFKKNQDFLNHRRSSRIASTPSNEEIRAWLNEITPKETP